MEIMKKILSFICSHLRIVATTIYLLILIIIFLFPPGSAYKDHGFGRFVYLFSEDAMWMSINTSIFYSEIAIVSLIYFAFMLFVIKK